MVRRQFGLFQLWALTSTLELLPMRPAAAQEANLSQVEEEKKEPSQSTSTDDSTPSYKSGQLFSLIFSLDGPSGDGLLKEPSEMQDFLWHMQNLTASFAPEFATLGQVRNVTTLCSFKTQNSFDGDLQVTPSTVASTTATNTGQQSGLEWEQLLYSNSTYQYEYYLNYTSQTVNVSYYPSLYQRKMDNSLLLQSQKLKEILDVPDDKVLLIKDIFPGPLNEYILYAQNQLLEESSSGLTVNITYSNQTTETYNITQAPTAAPSEMPSMFPTFYTNSSARGRYELSFVVQGPKNPKTMFINNTHFCEVMKSYTPAITPPTQNPEQIYTTCPTIDGAFSPIPPGSSSLAPAIAPAIAPATQQEQPNNQDGIAPSPVPSTILEQEETTDLNPTLTRSLFLRGTDSNLRRLQFNGNNTSQPPVPGIYPSYLWRYTVVMRYTSAWWNVSEYPDYLEQYINDNNDLLEQQLIEKFNLTNSTLDIVGFYLFFDTTNAPTEVPSVSPSTMPTFTLDSLEPTESPPTEVPSYYPTASGSPTPDPTEPPHLPPPPSLVPTPSPTRPPEPDDKAFIAVVVILVVFVGAVLMTALVFFYRKRKAQLDSYKSNLNSTRPSQDPAGSMVPPSSLAGTKDHQNYIASTAATAATVSPSESSVDHFSAVHNQSAPSQKVHASQASSLSSKTPTRPQHSKDLSNGSASLASTVSETVSSHESQKRTPSRSILSDIEEDPYADNDEDDLNGFTQQSPPLDPFSQYNDQNLEKMRNDVEDNVIIAGLDGMMSQAIGRALIMDGDVLSKETTPWHEAKTPVQLEANALWEVTEWMKQNQNVREDQKQDYMQELLNKMVTCVRKGYLGPEDGSRTIHECAGLLGLQLANELPNNTVILSGMQKTTTALDVTRAFRVFGPVDDAAVASNHRGFGFVRFKSHKPVVDAMKQFNTSEVVVRDVAITLKLLSAETES